MCRHKSYIFAPKLNWLNKMRRLEWGKNIKFGFLRRSSGFVCSDKNMFCTKCRQTL